MVPHLMAGYGSTLWREGAVRCMQMALNTSKNKIDYINTHGTSTPAGDITELKAVGEVVFTDYNQRQVQPNHLLGILERLQFTKLFIV